MRHHITAGIDGSPESLCAADWAAREALRRGLPLHLVHAFDEPSPRSHLPEIEVPLHSERGALDRFALQLSYAHPVLEVVKEQAGQPPVAALLAAARTADTLVVGSRGFSGLAGILVGSVALAVAARAACPVVLVRAGERPEDERPHLAAEPSPYRPVVLGIDLARPCDGLLEYAFGAAATRRTALHVLHAWAVPLVPSANATDPAEGKEHRLAAVLASWQHKFPDTQVTGELVRGLAGRQLLKAATGASLLVVGRRTSAGPHLGSTAHSVIHHVTCPVAVVPHD
ncbi:universal stress protein [Streptomyces sp. 21So2-11]|uniref:universal stress protein n=1 Tax=Streptomyces sp. 21So2-11 TaxID=3144408 RepID=UPI00321B9A1E